MLSSNWRLVNAYISSGLQGSWNAFSAKKGIKVPFGSVIVFSMWCVALFDLLATAERQMIVVAKSCTHGSSDQIRSRGRTVCGSVKRPKFSSRLSSSIAAMRAKEKPTPSIWRKSWAGPYVRETHEWQALTSS